jgi:uncharacterized alkaline shock family protein YloU
VEEDVKGNINVTENALASLLGLAAHEVPGVVGMAPANLKEGIQKILGQPQSRDGVVVSGEGSTRTCEVFVVVAFGTAIHAVAENVKDRIVHTAKSLAGIELSSVKVHVVGVAKPGASNVKKKGVRGG